MFQGMQVTRRQTECEKADTVAGHFTPPGCLLPIQAFEYSEAVTARCESLNACAWEGGFGGSETTSTQSYPLGARCAIRTLGTTAMQRSIQRSEKRGGVC